MPMRHLLKLTDSPPIEVLMTKDVTIQVGIDDVVKPTGQLYFETWEKGLEVTSTVKLYHRWTMIDQDGQDRTLYAYMWTPAEILT